MIHFCSLSSGSRGNAILASDGKTNIMIDCGISGAKIKAGLNVIGLKPEDIDAILITHEHSDHIMGAGILHRMSGAKIYANTQTMDLIENSLGKTESGALCVFENEFEIGGISVTPFKTAHDSVCSVGYRLDFSSHSFAVATDMGYVNEDTKKTVMGCEAVILESNHDIDMLKNGRYPYNLKQRILGKNGHLSNASAADFACELVKSGTKNIVLGHLSDENNLPALAYKTTLSAFSKENIKPDCDVRLSVARPMAAKVIL